MQNFINKTNMGIVSTLLLLISLSQTNILNYFFNTCLGRTILILIILLISYTNQILGIVAVLFIIIMFNSQMTKYRENLTNPTDSSSLDTQVSTNQDTVKDKGKDVKNIVLTNNKSVSNLDTSSTIKPETDGVENESNQMDNEESINLENSEKLLTSTEGFDVLGRENSLKRGKQSNSIMVGDYMRHSSNAIPYEDDKLSYFSLY